MFFWVWIFVGARMSLGFPVCGNRANVVAGLCYDEHIASVASATAGASLTPVAVASDLGVLLVAWRNNRTATIDARASVDGVVGPVTPLTSPLIDGQRAPIASLGLHAGLERHFALAFDDWTNASSASVRVAVLRVNANASIEIVRVLQVAPTSPFVADPDITPLPPGAASGAVAAVAFRGRVAGDDAGLDLVRLRFVNGSFSIDASRPYRGGGGLGAVNVFGASETSWLAKYGRGDGVSLFPRLTLFGTDTLTRKDVVLAWHECADAHANNCTVFWRTFTSALENSAGSPLSTVSTKVIENPSLTAIPSSLVATELPIGPGFGLKWLMTAKGMALPSVRTVGVSLIKPSGEFYGGDIWPGSLVGEPWSALSGNVELSVCANETGIATRAYVARPTEWDVPSDFNAFDVFCSACSAPQVAAVRRADNKVGFAVAFVSAGTVAIRELLVDSVPHPGSLFGKQPAVMHTTTTVTTSEVSATATTSLTATTSATTTTTTATATMTTTTGMSATTTAAATSTSMAATTMSATADGVAGPSGAALLPAWVVPVVAVLAALVAILACALAGAAVLVRRARAVTSSVEQYVPRSRVAAGVDDDNNNDDDNDNDEDDDERDNKGRVELTDVRPQQHAGESSSSAQPVPARSRIAKA